MARWEEEDSVQSSSNRSFLKSVEQVLGRSRGRAGLHKVHIVLAPFNSRIHPSPIPALRAFFDQVEPGLLIRELNSRGSMRKNGYRIAQHSHVSYRVGDADCIGKVVSIYVGSRPAAPYEAGCAVCVVRRVAPPAAIRVKHAAGCGMLIVSKTRQGPLDYVCSTHLLHRYAFVHWPNDDDDSLAALVRMEEL